jgi:predicted DNA-binding ribbon-helix-helix protein
MSSVVTISLEKSLKKRLRSEAARLDVSMSAYIRSLLEERLFFDPSAHQDEQNFTSRSTPQEATA